MDHLLGRGLMLQTQLRTVLAHWTFTGCRWWRFLVRPSQLSILARFWRHQYRAHHRRRQWRIKVWLGLVHQHLLGHGREPGRHQLVAQIAQRFDLTLLTIGRLHHCLFQRWRSRRGIFSLVQIQRQGRWLWRLFNGWFQCGYDWGWM